MQTRKGKWQAFEALSTLKGSLNEVRIDHHKKARPVLSEDKWAEMDEAFKLAIEENAEITLSYYIRGEIEELTGTIDKIDLVYKTIAIQSHKISFYDLVDAKVKTLPLR